MPTNVQEIEARLAFLRRAEKLKDTLRSAHTTRGRRESAAEHSWRFALFIMTFEDMLPELDMLRLLKICILHDLGEAIHGDVPAPEQDNLTPKSSLERDDFASLLQELPPSLSLEFMSLWDEYENATSLEAKVAKALDKLETILQHNQGKNPESFDYRFNLEYGKSHTDAVPLAAQIRELLDADTAVNAESEAE